MLDVQDARVLIEWPGRDRKNSVASQADSSWDDDNSPKGRATAVSSRGQIIESSPLRRGAHIQSPVSPTPAGPSHSTSLADLFSDSPEPEVVRVFEDAPSPVEEPEVVEGESFVSTQAATSFAYTLQSQSSELSELEEDPDEENDPIVHSFGPFGANISSRMASFTTNPSPETSRAHREPFTSPKPRSSSESTNDANPTPVVNHVVNQLAFSRLSSTPLSIIMNNLPAELKNASSTHPENRGLTKNDLRKMLNAASCIGEIHREGKDAAGKALESEYYYIPDQDTDEQRRAAVVDGLRKPSLRNCRKQHKVNKITMRDTSNLLTYAIAILLEEASHSLTRLDFGFCCREFCTRP
jgi:hypothetical protein